MLWKDWEPYHKVLSDYARREQSDRTCWYSCCIKSADYQCLICGEIIPNNGIGGMKTNEGSPRYYKTLREHGLQHLKEKNLLPFI